ncbi:MAG: pyridoxal phosphate-dependent aminotransferase [Anaerolineae bacterium]
MQIAPFKLERYFARWEFKARYLLCSSDCESMRIGDLLQFAPEAETRLKETWLGYTEYEGALALRTEIAKLYTSISPEQIMVHAGAEEGIFAFFAANVTAGDHVIVHAPGYQSLYEIARSIGCEVSLWTTRDDDGWDLDLNWLQHNIRRNTRLIVVNCPHNPTGYLMRAETQRELVEMARKYGILIFSDEVYRGLEHDPSFALPSMCDVYENAVSLGALAKTWGLAGLRLGWIATHNPAIYAKSAAYKDYLSICNAAPSETLGIIALQHRDQIAERNLGIIKANLAMLDAFFARHAERFIWQRPHAGSTAFPALKAQSGAQAFCEDVVNGKSVLLLPSICYDYGDRHFRIGFGRANLPEALAQLEAYLTERPSQ